MPSPKPPAAKKQKKRRHCLGHTLYLWDASTASVSELVTIEEAKGPITSIIWSPDAYYLALGLNNSQVQLWDSSSNTKIKTFKGRITCVEQQHPHNWRHGRQDCQLRCQDQACCGDLQRSLWRGLWAQVVSFWKAAS
ncbi:unnamed protein product [Brassica oleracea var. botrytis]|uniref:Uncharacterized protein n=1 Tax=Brassica oleracea TaxID=3712 RepID=A0A3P6E9E5_BRAOL|nr:unnamed protein product [Brassica oleracea]